MRSAVRSRSCSRSWISRRRSSCGVNGSWRTSPEGEETVREQYLATSLLSVLIPLFFSSLLSLHFSSLLVCSRLLPMQREGGAARSFLKFCHASKDIYGRRTGEPYEIKSRWYNLKRICSMFSSLSFTLNLYFFYSTLNSLLSLFSLTCSSLRRTPSTLPAISPSCYRKGTSDTKILVDEKKIIHIEKTSFSLPFVSDRRLSLCPGTREQKWTPQCPSRRPSKCYDTLPLVESYREWRQRWDSSLYSTSIKLLYLTESKSDPRRVDDCALL